MLQALHSPLNFPGRSTPVKRLVNPIISYRHRREREVRNHFLSTSVPNRTLHLAGEVEGPLPNCGTYFIARPTHAAHLPYDRNEFDAIVCHGLATDLDATGLDDLFWEATRICSAGGRFLLTVSNTMEGAKYTHQPAVVEDLRGTRWREVAVIGMMLLPIDRLPAVLRTPLGRLDALLCRTPLKQFANYRTYVFEKL